MRRYFDKRLFAGIFLGVFLAVGFVYVFKGNLFDRGITAFNRSSPYVFGLDVSHYQGKINWSKVGTKHPVKFVFIRSTMGIDGADEQFAKNWKQAKAKNFIRGAYHYFRPNQDATAQFEQFKKYVSLSKGDLPPVIDVEVLSDDGPKKLRARIQTFLNLTEAHYGVKPIIYSSSKFYRQNIQEHIKGYPLWIAAYSGKNRLLGLDWKFHQFSERVRVAGIKGFVDGNDFKGKIKDLEAITIK